MHSIIILVANKMLLINEIILPFASIKLFEPTLIKIEFFGGTIISKEEVAKIIDVIGELSNHQEVLVLNTAADDTQFTTEARHESASENGLKYTLADAFVARNLAQKLLVNFYIKFNQPAKPTKAFINEEEAIEWLYSFTQK